MNRVAAPIVRYVLPLLLIAAVLVSFCPLPANDFVNLDDPFYFIANQHYRGLSLTHLRWMFTTLYMGHYQPLSWLTHGLVYCGWGVSPAAFHVVNLLLHAANAVVFSGVALALLQAAYRNDPRGNEGGAPVAAAAGALFFAIHPLRVEAVAWATERQEVLCALFFLLAVLAYLRMQNEKPRSGAWRRWYIGSIISFTLSLMSKATGITLPLVLLVVDVYPLRRLPGARRATPWGVIAEKIPYVVVAGGAALVVLLAKRPEAMVTLAEHGVAARVMQCMYALCFYPWKTVAPLQLSPLYLLHKPLDPTAPRFVLAALAVVGVTTGLVLMRRRWPAALAAWSCYVVLLLPVSGIVQSGPQITADRYTYLACMPWAVLVAAGVSQCLHRWRRPFGWQHLAAATAGLFLLILGAQTAQQTRVWKDSLTLWNHVLSIEPDNFFAYDNRGEARYASGDVNGALADFDRAIQLDPSYANAYDNRGTARLEKGDTSGALADYTLAIRLDPRRSTAYYNRGKIKAKGDPDGALADYQQAIALNPEYAAAYNARGRVYQAKGDLNAALADYTRAIDLNREYANAYNNRGTVRRTMGDLAGAMEDFNLAVHLAANNPPQRAVFERNLTDLQRQLAEGARTR